MQNKYPAESLIMHIMQLKHSGVKFRCHGGRMTHASNGKKFYTKHVLFANELIKKWKKNIREEKEKSQ